MGRFVIIVYGICPSISKEELIYDGKPAKENSCRW